MISARRVGGSVTLRFEVRNAAGSLQDATVTLQVITPTGPLSPAPTIDHVTGSGIYEATIALPTAGLWSWRWTATGDVTAADDGVLRVEAIAAPDLYVTEEELRRDMAGSLVDSSKIDADLLERACRESSRAVDDYCSQAAPGWRRFWLDLEPTLRRYVPNDPWVLDVADIGSTAGLQVTVSGTPWTLDLDYQLGPVESALVGGRPATQLEALRTQWPVPLTEIIGLGLAGRRAAPRPAAPAVDVLARHGWPTHPEPVRKAARIVALRLFKRPGAPYGTEGVSDFGPVRIARGDPDVGPLLDRAYTLGPVFA